MILKQKLFINALIRDLGLEADHLRNLIRKYYQQEELAALDRKQASKLIEALKANRRHGIKDSSKPA